MMFNQGDNWIGTEPYGYTEQIGLDAVVGSSAAGNTSYVSDIPRKMHKKEDSYRTS